MKNGDRAPLSFSKTCKRQNILVIGDWAREQLVENSSRHTLNQGCNSQQIITGFVVSVNLSSKPRHSGSWEEVLNNPAGKAGINWAVPNKLEPKLSLPVFIATTRIPGRQAQPASGAELSSQGGVSKCFSNLELLFQQNWYRDPDNPWI